MVAIVALLGIIVSVSAAFDLRKLNVCDWHKIGQWSKEALFTSTNDATSMGQRL